MPRSPKLLLPRKGSVPTAGCHGNPSSHPLPWTREDQTPGEAPQHPREATLLVKKRARSRERLKSQLIPPRSVPLPRASRRGVSEKPEKTSAPVINHHRDHLAPAEAAVTCCHLLSKWPEPPAASQALGDTGSCCWHGLGSVLNSWAGSALQLLLPGIPSHTWMGQGGFKNNPGGVSRGRGTAALKVTQNLGVQSSRMNAGCGQGSGPGGRSLCQIVPVLDVHEANGGCRDVPAPG